MSFLFGVERDSWTPKSEQYDFAHAFGSRRRVFGFGGRLAYRDRAVHLEQFVACCTGQLDIESVIAVREQIVARIERANWDAEAGQARPLTWQSGVSELTWIESNESVGDSRNLVHLVLTHGTPGEVLFRKVFTLVSEQIPGLNAAAQPRRVEHDPFDAPGTELLPADLARAIRHGRPIIYTGAGVSRASGISTFDGDASLGIEIPLLEPFPGVAVDWMIQNPAKLATHFGTFQARLLTASPNPAHRAIARLERLHPIPIVITNNFDQLHEAAGSRVVRRPHQTGGPIAEELAADLLLVAGISTDEHRLIERFRQNGGQVIAIDPMPPRFLTPDDGFVRGPAEVVFPQVVESLLVARANAVSPPVRPDTTPEQFVSLVKSVQSTAHLAASDIHGDRHWRRVAWLGAHLAEEVVGCDPWIVLLFALLHDSRRVNEQSDPNHGRRAAEFVRALNHAELGLEPDRLELLESACWFHADGDISQDPTVGTCWDADRLDLWRCGMRPEPHYLSTGAALDPARIEWSGRPADLPGWEGLYERFDRLYSARN